MEPHGWTVITFMSGADPDYCDLTRCVMDAFWCETREEAEQVAARQPGWASPHIIITNRDATTVFHRPPMGEQ